MAPSQAELARRRIVGVNAETVTDVTSTDFPGHYPGENHAWSLSSFKKAFTVDFHHNTAYDASFSIKGIDASIANAFRRIMIAEIPSLAIETVYVNNNTSVVQDEVLAHRLGLVPLKGLKEGIDWLKWFHKPSEEDDTEGSTAADDNTIVMELKVECTRNPDAAKDETDPEKAYINAHVLASQIKYKPVGRQDKIFMGEGEIQSTNPDILVAKLRPGQVIDVDMHAIKGIGMDHAKFSPVATASYRLLPTIDIVKPIIGAHAHKFARCFPRGVIGIEKVTKSDISKDGDLQGHEGEDKAVVRNAMKDTVSREVLRHEEFEGKVKLGRVRDHFIFSVESVGQWESDALFLESIKILKTKCERFKRNLESLNT